MSFALILKAAAVSAARADAGIANTEAVQIVSVFFMSTAKNVTYSVNLIQKEYCYGSLEWF